eukprot:CAMPEP_0115635722 /NCGR_PEP_ID=MMETSP0272-20121206/33278_1 /TAXON_ID=71861 /ORGANISM="Scrippsiella trochoidea, Strain CCMP3099" /LENGTH=171 /DNA_ID=CAMNT_0003072661 /DNA_START=47 /DNA_END=563 /DNA_ORIENTATION=-
MAMASDSELAAAGLAGVVAGALTFVSAVDARTLTALATEGDEVTLRKFFPVWWPAGRDLMAPLLLATGAAHAAAYRSTRKPLWMGTGAAIFGIIPYTAFILGEDIAALRRADSDEVCSTARRFSLLHQPRMVVALLAFGASLVALAAADGGALGRARAHRLLTTGSGRVQV